MIFSSGSQRRASTRVRRRVRIATAVTGALAMVAVPATGSFAADASAADASGAVAAPPAYTAVSTAQLAGALRSDIAGSAFVDKDGAFHWTTGDNWYPASSTSKPTPIGWAKTFTNDDLSAVSAGYGSTTKEVTDDTWYGTPGSLCYQLDKRAVNAIPSPQEDDHCDVIGVWVDPTTGTWHALVNDEYQFDPWQTTGPDATLIAKIHSAHHNNRILLATSTDKGANWKYDGVALTPNWDADGIITPETSPGTTYPFGNSGCRLFIDYSSGYFYITYNVKIYKKPGSSTVASWTEMARSPISDKMAPGTWEKYYDGSWSQPGIGGIDGNVGDIPGLTVSYDPTTDVVAYKGKAANGGSLDLQAFTVPSDHEFQFADADGTLYTGNTLTHRFTAPDGTTVKELHFTDPATGQQMDFEGKDDVYQDGKKVVEGGIFITQTDPKTGSSRQVKVNTGSTVYIDQTTHHVYLPFGNNESAISYDAYSQRYRIVGYDGNVYETADLGDPTSWKTVGTNPAGSVGGYLTTLDAGSLTNQNVTGSSYLTVSDLTGLVTRVAMTPHTADQPVYSTGRVPVDTNGQKVDADSVHSIAIGGKWLGTDARPGRSGQWKLVPVANPDYAYGSGFYRLENTRTGRYLQVAGSTAAAERAMGAQAVTGAKQPDAVPTSSGSLGTPGGSDQWYIQVVATHGHTSLAGSHTYRLVNRNSGLALAFSHGRFHLEQQKPGDAGQYITFRPATGSHGHQGGHGHGHQGGGR